MELNPEKPEITSLDFSLSLSEPIRAICSPIFKCLNLKTFIYSQVFSSGDFIYTCTDLEWIKYFNHLHLYNNKDFQQDYFHLDNYGPQGSFLCVASPEPKTFHSHLYEYGMWNCLTLFNKNKDNTECWVFGSTPKEESITNLYFNKMEIFKRFCFYFQKEFSKIIETSNEKKYGSLKFHPCKEHVVPETFYTSTTSQINRYYLSGKYDGTYLSKREAECLFFLTRGSPIKDIANKLTLSPLTIKTYIEKAKLKTQLKTKPELIKLFFDEGLNDALSVSLKLQKLIPNSQVRTV